MAEPRLIGKQSGRPVQWAPRALAVLSCALALLAAQPNLLANAPLGTGKPALMKVAGTGGGAETAQKGVGTVGFRSQSKEERRYAEPAAAWRASRLHILATVEILQRLLSSELRPVSQQWQVGAFWFEPICIGVIELGAEVGTGAGRAMFSELPPPAERVFAIEHCLLAPPIS